MKGPFEEQAHWRERWYTTILFMFVDWKGIELAQVLFRGFDINGQ